MEQSKLMWWIAFFPLVGIALGILLYFLRPFFKEQDKFPEDVEDSEE